MKRMIGDMFSISTHNIGYAAMRAAEQSAGRLTSREVPATSKLKSHAEVGDDEIYVEIRDAFGYSRDIHIGSAKVHSILRIDDPVSIRVTCEALHCCPGKADPRIVV